MCPALGIDGSKDKLDLQTVQQAEHEDKLRAIQDSKRQLYERYALGEIDLETYRSQKAVYDAELVQASITAVNVSPEAFVSTTFVS